MPRELPIGIRQARLMLRATALGTTRPHNSKDVWIEPGRWKMSTTLGAPCLSVPSSKKTPPKPFSQLPDAAFANKSAWSLLHSSLVTTPQLA
eukprot:9469572-Pyramimonas_sp.AAC.1